MNWQRIVCLDLEMCCWNDGRSPHTGEIIEIGLAEVDLVAGEILRTAQYYVKPDRDEISEFCTELTGITQRIVDRQGRPLSEVLASIQEKFGGRNKIYGSWGRDDFTLLSECRQKNIEYPFKEFLNIATLFKLHKRIKNKRFGHRKAMDMMGLNWEGRQHSGVVDATNLARLALAFM